LAPRPVISTSDRRKGLFVGALGVLLFGSATIYIFYFPFHPIALSDVELVQGTVSRVEVLKRPRGSDALQIWLERERFPFRADAGYPGYFRKEALWLLQPAAAAEIGVLHSQRSSPLRDRLRGENFIPMCSLTAGGKPAYTVEDYNRWHIKSEASGRYVAPVLLLGSLAFFVSTLRRSATYQNET
jgi:hypothetical protein